MTQTSLYEVKLTVPPIKEQDDIIESIENTMEKLNKTISTIEKEITLTQEYKTALIAEAVTGKIDVRGFEMSEIIEDEVDEDIVEDLSLEAEYQNE